MQILYIIYFAEIGNLPQSSKDSKLRKSSSKFEIFIDILAIINSFKAL